MGNHLPCPSSHRFCGFLHNPTVAHTPVVELFTPVDSPRFVKGAHCKGVRGRHAQFLFDFDLGPRLAGRPGRTNACRHLLPPVHHSAQGLTPTFRHNFAKDASSK
jgi:hypothetical protein